MNPGRPWKLACSIGGALMLPAALVHADQTSALEIVLAQRDCGEGSDLEIARVLGIELHAAVTVRSGDEPDLPTEKAGATTILRVAVVCHGQVADIEVVDPVTAKSIARKVSLDRTVRSARGRLLALAAAELVTTSWSELETNPSPAVPPASPPPAPAVVRAARDVVHAKTAERSSSGWQLGTLALVRAFPASGAYAFGGGALVERRLGPLLSLTGDLEADAGVTERRLGSVSMTSATGSVAAAFGVRRTSLRLSAALGLRAGWVRLRGSPVEDASGSTLSGFWGGPLAHLALSGPASSALQVGARFEGGYAPFGVVGHVAGDVDVAAHGPWVGGQLLVSLRP